MAVCMNGDLTSLWILTFVKWLFIMIILMMVMLRLQLQTAHSQVG